VAINIPPLSETGLPAHMCRLWVDTDHTAGRTRWLGNQRRRGNTRLCDFVWSVLPKRVRFWNSRSRSLVITWASSVLSVLMVDSSILAGSCNLANNE
jgi:hypothetical protein